MTMILSGNGNMTGLVSGGLPDGTVLPADLSTGGPYWDTSGRLGIGTTSPTNTLSVSGNANITGNTTLGDASTDTVTVNGYMGVGGAGSASAKIVLAATQTTTGSVQYGINGAPVFGSDATLVGAVYSAQPRTSAASYTIDQAIGYRAIDVVQGAGSTITSQYGVYIEDQTKGTNNYGITSLVSSGTNKWNIYASGTANNYFAGNVGIGTPAYISRVLSAYSSGSTMVGSIVTNLSGAFLGFKDSGSTDDTYVRFGSSGNNAVVYAGGSERARIDSSGNLGLGVTPSAWGSSWDAFEYLGGALTTYSGLRSYLINNAYNNGTNYIYKNNGYAESYLQWDGKHAWFTAPSGTAGNAITFTQAMTLDASGNLQFNSGYGSAATAYGCRAWVNFNGTGTVAIRASGNVSSITDNGTGDYTVNFTTAMPDANYSVSGVTQFGSTAENPRVVVIPKHLSVPTASYVRICTRPGSATSGTGNDCDYVNVTIFR